jgi:hypothetical protein
MCRQERLTPCLARVWEPSWAGRVRRSRNTRTPCSIICLAGVWLPETLRSMIRLRNRLEILLRIIRTEHHRMPGDESHTTWTGGQYERPLSPEDLAALEWMRKPSRQRNIPQSVRDSLARHLRALRRERLAATQDASQAVQTSMEPEETIPRLCELPKISLRETAARIPIEE